MKYNSSTYRNEKIISIELTSESKAQIKELTKLLDSSFMNFSSITLNVRVKITTETYSQSFDYEMSEWEMNQSGWEDSFLCSIQNKIDIDILK